MAREFNYRVARWLNKGLMVVGGTVTSKQDAVDYLTWTYFFRRLVQNPTYYNLESTEYADVNEFLSGLVENTLAELEDARCLEDSPLPKGQGSPPKRPDSSHLDPESLSH
eukprot:8778441-Pyramimonas_sp.AAC.1